jgi:hypothetical protein
METEANAVLGVLITIAVIMFFLGIWAGGSAFDFDTYDCTVKCQMGRSIQWKEKCYCEAK